MSELTEEILHQWVRDNSRVAAKELLAIRARVAQLEAALRTVRKYAEDHDDEFVPFVVDGILAQPAESETKEGAVGGPSVVSLELPGGHPAEAPPLFELEDGLHELAFPPTPPRMKK